MSKEKKLVAPSYEQLTSLAPGKVVTISTGGKNQRWFFIQEEGLTETSTGIRGMVREASHSGSQQITILPGGDVVV